MFDLLLNNISRHIQLDPADRELIMSSFRHKKVRKHQYLLQQGEPCTADYFVIKGILRQYEVDEQEKENIVQFALEDWWITDWYSMLHQTPSIYNIDALEDSEVLQIDKATLEQLFVQLPKFNFYFRIILQKAYSYLQRRVLFMQKPAEERYREFLRYYAHFEQRMSQAQIASYLGIARESLSRIRNQALRN